MIISFSQLRQKATDLQRFLWLQREVVTITYQTKNNVLGHIIPPFKDKAELDIIIEKLQAML